MRARSQNCASSERIGDSRPNDRPEALGRLHDGVLIPGFVVGQHCHLVVFPRLTCAVSPRWPQRVLQGVQLLNAA
eukprot:2630528-Pyramimonas_sp.AAC.1